VIEQNRLRKSVIFFSKIVKDHGESFTAAEIVDALPKRKPSNYKQSMTFDWNWLIMTLQPLSQALPRNLINAPGCRTSFRGSSWYCRHLRSARKLNPLAADAARLRRLASKIRD
jgi:hypothetical protein